ncbi:hypothetical protein ONR75_15675 [Rhodopseudomonas sp. P2A-2r]|uniref:hypothetical protein n=1 Tax=Rhodopseudomonas sp. P2A-2r TaxID=2991972 RepID=UPI0022343E03|nr:hypothetical protein [Rhodopseudomonas sp. P2A-2r]UZE51872.1 hypothetical protein ONR75_15675 [Rhodopseudomonas sp. P2A-2r]
MNALVSIDRILSPETITRPVDVLTPAIVFAPGGVESIISGLEAEVRATPRDMTTDAGRKAISSLAYKVARSKTALDDMGKELVADIKKQSGAIDAERRVIRDRLDALRDEVRSPLTAWEELEKRRVDDHEQALVFIVTAPRFIGTVIESDVIRARIADVEATYVRDWQEFNERADDAARETLPQLRAMLNVAVKAEADAAELAELRQMKADREAADIAASNAAAAAETSRRQAEKDAAETAQRAEQEKARDIARAEQAARDQAEGIARALEEHNHKIARAQEQEQAEKAKREANTRHRNKIIGEVRAALASLEVDGLPVGLADVIARAIAAGRIPHVSITY